MSVYFADETVTLHRGNALDVLAELPSASVNCCVTSPPYFGLRDYGDEGQQGLESTPAEYVATMTAVFAEVRRVLADDGTLWLNLGDSYSTSPRGNDNGWDKSRISNPGRVQKAQRAALRQRDFDRPAKNMLGIPWRLAFAMQDDGWILRNDIIWAKTNSMPESVRDRLSGKYEHLFMFSKSQRYWFDLDPIREPHTEDSIKRAQPHRAAPGKSRREGFGIPPGNRPHTARLDQANHPAGRNPGDVWTIPTSPFPGAHFATFPIELPRRAIAAGCKPDGTVLDPYSGSGTTGAAAAQLGRRYIGIELNAEYLDLSLRTRLAQGALFEDGGAA